MRRGRGSALGNCTGLALMLALACRPLSLRPFRGCVLMQLCSGYSERTGPGPSGRSAPNELGNSQSIIREPCDSASSCRRRLRVRTQCCLVRTCIPSSRHKLSPLQPFECLMGLYFLHLCRSRARSCVPVRGSQRAAEDKTPPTVGGKPEPRTLHNHLAVSDDCVVRRGRSGRGHERAMLGGWRRLREPSRHHACNAPSHQAIGAHLHSGPTGTSELGDDRRQAAAVNVHRSRLKDGWLILRPPAVLHEVARGRSNSLRVIRGVRRQAQRV